MGKSIKNSTRSGGSGPSGIDKIAAGIQGLDEVLNGGVPKGAMTLLSGGPGTGKTNKVPIRPPAILRCTARLFVCGDALYSRRARENLQRLQETLHHVKFKVDIIDVNETPQAALDQGIFVNPALQVIEPSPGMLIYGDLSDLEALAAIFPEGDEQ